MDNEHFQKRGTFRYIRKDPLGNAGDMEMVQGAVSTLVSPVWGGQGYPTLRRRGGDMGPPLAFLSFPLTPHMPSRLICPHHFYSTTNHPISDLPHTIQV